MAASTRGAERLPGPALRLHALNVGHGDALLIQFPRGSWGVVDAGSYYRRRDAGGMVLRYLRAWGARRLAFVCVTHPHEDHDNGIQTILESDLAIDEFWYSAYVPVEGQDTVRLTWQAYMESALRRRDRGALAVPPAWHQGERRTIDGVAVHCLAPTTDLVRRATEVEHNPNNASVVLALAWHNRVLLLGADAERPAWEEIVPRAAAASLPRAAIIKVPHHGSRHGIPRMALAALMQVAEGYLAVVSCQRHPTRPHATVLSWIMQSGGRVACTTRCMACPIEGALAATGTGAAGQAASLGSVALAAMGAGPARPPGPGPDALIASLTADGGWHLHRAAFTPSGIEIQGAGEPCSNSTDLVKHGRRPGGQGE